MTESNRNTEITNSSRPLTLAELRPGDTCVIREIECNGGDSADLLEMGLTSGTPVRLVKFAPLGDPLEIHVRGYHLSIRRHDAQSILVTPDQE